MWLAGRRPTDRGVNDELSYSLCQGARGVCGSSDRGPQRSTDWQWNRKAYAFFKDVIELVDDLPDALFDRYIRIAPAVLISDNLYDVCVLMTPNGRCVDGLSVPRHVGQALAVPPRLAVHVAVSSLSRRPQLPVGGQA